MIKKLKQYRQNMKHIALLELRINRHKMIDINSPKIQIYEKQIEKLKLDLGEIDIVLEYLPPNEMYLVKEHYIMCREWIDIELTYNQNFKSKPGIKENTLCKKASRALKTLEEFYKKIDSLELQEFQEVI